MNTTGRTLGKRERESEKGLPLVRYAVAIVNNAIVGYLCTVIVCLQYGVQSFSESNRN